MSERTILYLNVNGFLGKQEKKKYTKYPKVIKMKSSIKPSMKRVKT